MTNEMAAYKLADVGFPGHFGVFYKSSQPTKNANEAKVSAKLREKVAGSRGFRSRIS